MKIEKKIHNRWKNIIKIKGVAPLIGKYQYIYSNDKGQEISLIDFRIKNCWEIYCLKGDLFIDNYEFKTKKEAEEKIINLLSK